MLLATIIRCVLYVITYLRKSYKQKPYETMQNLSAGYYLYMLSCGIIATACSIVLFIDLNKLPIGVYGNALLSVMLICSVTLIVMPHKQLMTLLRLKTR